MFYTNTLRGWEVVGTGSGLCPMEGFDVFGVESSGSVTTKLLLLRSKTGTQDYYRRISAIRIPRETS